MSTPYEEHFKANVLPHLVTSSVFLSIVTEESIDIKQATEIGAAVLLDKPIMLIVPKGRKLPGKLIKIADSIIYDFTGSDKDKDRVMKALDSLK